MVFASSDYIKCPVRHPNYAGRFDEVADVVGHIYRPSLARRLWLLLGRQAREELRPIGTAAR